MTKYLPFYSHCIIISVDMLLLLILFFMCKVVDYLIDPFVEGTSTGDPEYLSMRYSFPDLWNLEERFGSFIAGAIQSKLSSRKEKSGEKKGSLKKTKHQCGSFSFKGGMQTLADTLSKEIGVDEIKLNSKVLSLSYCPDGKSARENWSVSFAAKHVNHSQALSVDAVIVTLSYMPLSVIITTFKKENVKRPLEGFGVLVPSKEQNNGLKNLGNACYHLYDGKTLYECSHFYWKKAFPLYGYNYDSVIAESRKWRKTFLGSSMQVPNQRGGLPVGKAIASECKAAELVISYLESSSDGK
ncbi:hypothetical protein FEM48_Zijuj09G0217000 [Ziziphus jujuba var. spinosa]|uniref:Amine oxidase domain-containing protein n=1 Tax=Ziziphus jujuba var. spinosa TaxID=714518 RepID=A0A978UVH0_ZIZJJ|nr:hypothetical protein FEM48_Zijuj09G0217000 [Ziziphus jujuba var. spinosa]